MVENLGLAVGASMLPVVVPEMHFPFCRPYCYFQQ